MSESQKQFAKIGNILLVVEYIIILKRREDNV